MKKILVVGSINLDMVVNVDHCPMTGETILTDHLDLIPGGKGANQAYTAGRLGGNVSMLGAVGDDSYGNLLINNLISADVNTTAVIKKEGNSSGLAFIHVNKEGDNSITVVSGANALITKDDIDAHRELFEEADILLLQLEIPINTVCYAAKIAKDLGKTVILDPAPAPSVLPEDLFKYADIVKPNKTELGMLSGMEISEKTLSTAAAIIRKKGVKHVLVTLGEKGVYLDSEVYGILQIPAIKVAAVDTTGAGDAFTGALAVMLAMDKTLPEAIAFANRVSSIVVTRKGAQSSIPGIDEVI